MKSKTTAAILAIFLGSIGVHRFYLNQSGLGIKKRCNQFDYNVLFWFSCDPAGTSLISSTQL